MNIGTCESTAVACSAAPRDWRRSRPTGARAQAPALPTSPVAINVIDVGGALALMQKAFEAYRKAKPEFVSRITYVKAPAPELAEQGQGAAGRRARRPRHGPDRQRRARGRP